MIHKLIQFVQFLASAFVLLLAMTLIPGDRVDGSVLGTLVLAGLTTGAAAAVVYALRGAQRIAGNIRRSPLDR